MNKSYVIHWRSKTNGRIGTGTTRFERAEGESLVEELNRDYPEIEHRLVDLNSDEAGSPVISLALAEPVAAVAD